MTTPELLEFIRIEHALGMSLSEIAHLLINEGEWDMADVAEAFRALGLPEEGLESFSKPKIGEPVVTTPQPKFEPQLDLSSVSVPSNRDEVVYHAPAPTPSAAPANMQYERHAAPMHYVEEPEKVVKPTLARPASLSGQVSRNLVRTVSTAATYAKIQKPGQFGHGHEGPTIHVSKLQSGEPSLRGVAGPAGTAGSALPKPKEVNGSISEIERALSLGVEIKEEEPRPSSVVSNAVKSQGENVFNINKFHIATGGEIKESKEEEASPVLKLEKELKSDEKPKADEVLKVEEKPKVEEIVKMEEAVKVEEKPKIEEAPKIEEKPKIDEIPKVEEASKIVETPKIEEPVKTEEKPKVEEIPKIEEKSKVEEVSKIEEKPKVEEVLKVEEKPKVEEVLKVEEKPKAEEAVKVEEKPKIEEVPKIEEKPKIEEIPKVENKPKIEEVPKVEEKPKEIIPPPVATPVLSAEAAAVMAQAQALQQAYIQGQQQAFIQQQQLQQQQQAQTPIIIQQPPTQYAMQMPPQIFAAPPAENQPSSMIGSQSHVTEIGSTSPDIEEQAYLAQFGQAPMPKGLVRAQTQVSQPTIIYQQLVTPAPVAPLPKPVEEKKPEPMRFDIGRVRTAHKTDQSTYTGRPSVISAISGMQPVESKSIEDVFKSQMPSDIDSILPPTEKKDVLHSLKVPSKRTMTTDLIHVQEGVLPGQVVSQSTKEGAISGVALPNTAAAASDEEPIPPPPPKKSSKSMLLITSVIAGFIVVGAAAAYYFIVVRLPSAKEVYDNALSVALRGPAIAYDGRLMISATSTDAEPEYISVNAYASGTLAVSSKAFENGNHEVNVGINHTGVEAPISFYFDGNVGVLDNFVYVTQKTPTKGTQIENTLKDGEWVKVPYQELGSLMGFSSSEVAAAGEYGLVTPSTSLFKIFTTNSPVIVDGSIEKFEKNNREFYRIPLKVDAKKMVQAGDLLSKYVRGASAISTLPNRAAILEARYSNITGEIIVDKLLMRPTVFSLKAKFDPSKISLNGEMSLVFNLNFLTQKPNVDIKAKTLDELKSQRSEESASEGIIAKDAPVRVIVPVVDLAIKQYAEKLGKYPINLSDLVSSSFLGPDALTPDILDNLLYSSYVEKPKDIVSGVRCTAKNNKCNFYHLGATLLFRKSVELDSDADYETSMISGADEAGCRKESNSACYDRVGDLNTKSPEVVPE